MAPSQDPGHCHTGSHPENFHQQDPGSAATQLVGEVQTPATLLSTKEKRVLHNHLCVVNTRGDISKGRFQQTLHQRKGRLCYVRSTPGSTQRLQMIIRNSFTYTGTCLLNCLPRELWDITGVTPDSFKRQLDNWLRNIPDEPSIPGYSSFHHNSLPKITRGPGAEECPGASKSPLYVRRYKMEFSKETKVNNHLKK